jgi:ribonuclease HI
MNRSAIGAVLMPHIRIGGRHVYPGPLIAYVQTDGSYRRHESYVAAILRSSVNHDLVNRKQRITAASSTEAEWASVAYGIRLAIEKDEHTIALENDNLSVVHGLLWPQNPLKHHYARHYRDEIYKLSTNTVWTGVR